MDVRGRLDTSDSSPHVRIPIWALSWRPCTLMRPLWQGPESQPFVEASSGELGNGDAPESPLRRL